MLVGQALHALQFDDKLFFDYQIGHILANISSFLTDWEGDLRLGGDTSQGKLVKQGALVNLLKKPSPKHP